MASSKQASPIIRFIFGRLFPLPFIIVGAICTYNGLTDVWRASESTSWPTTEGRVVSSSVKSESDSDGTTYKASVKYTFTVDGREYSNDKIAFGDFSSSKRSRAQGIAGRYPDGKAVTVTYRPDDPAVCVLEPGMKGQVWGMPLFGLVFFSIGTFMAIVLPRAMRPAPTAEQVQTMYPGQPWRVRRDWAEGRVRSANIAWPLLFMGLIFSALGGLASASILPEELRDRNYAALLVLLFPLVGLLLLGTFLYKRFAGRRFGDCSFEMTAIPGALGGSLEGIIRTSRRIEATDGIRLTLFCIRSTTTHSGDSNSTTENVLWQSEKVLRGDMPDLAPGSGVIPVFFRLPTDQPESSGVRDSADGIHWRLEATAKVPGPDFNVKFDVPVYKVAISPATDMTDPTEKMQIPIEELRLCGHSRIQVSESPAGSEFYFPAARNIGAALGMTFVFVLLGSITAIIIPRIPLFFGIITGLFAMIFFLVSIPLWLRRDRVTIDRRGVHAETRWLFFGRTRDFAADDVTGFKTHVGMSSGTKRYFDIQLTMRSGRDATIATAIADKAEVDWLIAKMKKALGRGV